MRSDRLVAPHAPSLTPSRARSSSAPWPLLRCTTEPCACLRPMPFSFPRASACFVARLLSRAPHLHAVAAHDLHHPRLAFPDGKHRIFHHRPRLWIRHGAVAHRRRPLPLAAAR